MNFRAPVPFVVVVGHEIHCVGIVNTLAESGFATAVECMTLDAAFEIKAAEGPDLVVVCADGEINKVDGLIRRLSRRNRQARIVLITRSAWEERLDYVGESRINACVNPSIPREQFISVLRLAMDGYFVI